MDNNSIKEIIRHCRPRVEFAPYTHQYYVCTGVYLFWRLGKDDVPRCQFVAKKDADEAIKLAKTQGYIPKGAQIYLVDTAYKIHRASKKPTTKKTKL